MSNETERPATPAPRIVVEDNFARITPAAEILDLSPRALTAHQEDALRLLDAMRQRVLDGQLLGVLIAGLRLHNGDLSITSEWSSGASDFRIHASSAAAYLNSRFQNFLIEG